MKTILIAAAALATATFATGPTAQAADIQLGLTIGGSNGQLHIGTGPYAPIRPVHKRRHHGHAHVAPPYWHGGCVRPRKIRRRLRRQGWWGIEPIRFRPHILVVRAHRPNGSLFKLKIDRCSGHIVKARLLAAGGHFRHDYWRGRPYRGYKH